MQYLVKAAVPVCSPLSTADSGEIFRAVSQLPQPFFIDSSMVGERLGRFSILGAQPFAAISSKGRAITTVQNGRTRKFLGDPFPSLREMLQRYGRPAAGSGRWPCAGGAVGYLSYDLKHFIERLPDAAVDDVGWPDMYFGFYDAVVCVDHHDACAAVIAYDGDGGRAQARADRLRAHIEQADRGTPPPPVSQHSAGLKGNFTREGYIATVRRCKDYIAAGDIFQVNLSQRFDTTVGLAPPALYERLRAINPAPFACYLQHGDYAVLSSSPERFLKVSRPHDAAQWHVETRPIKGTRPRRPGHEAFNERMRRELIGSPKDNAELTMIVDLERNDLGRVCSYGSVKVTQRVVLEEYPTVYHLVATVEGDLHHGKDIIDLLKATFPGGSITGAPKIRAMEIIDELEPTRRGVYTGAIGYISFDGTADFNIAIRTILMKGQRVLFQVGGGIVADSDPAAEYDETLVKAEALFDALGCERPERAQHT
ncbi:MAG: aminodeoxychorismate synthase component I [Planctomycetes bacterium]|nr:aminodeoxychorismate synthase component I [Planctomycetota bacterium]